MRFIARPKAPTNPEADHSAPTIPVTKVRPAAGDSVSFRIGSSSAFAVPSGKKPPNKPSNDSVVC